MILIEPHETTNNNNEDMMNSKRVVESNTTAINTANALLAISAAFQSTQSMLQQSMAVAGKGTANATCDGISSCDDSSVSQSMPQSNAGSESSHSEDNDMDDLIYKNSPLRHYHNHYRSNQPTSSKQSEQTSATAAPMTASAVPSNK